MKINFFILFLCSSMILKATDTLQVKQPQLTDEQYQQLYQAFADSLVRSFEYEEDQVVLKGDIATINIPKGFKYLNSEDSEKVLTTLWGNPPSPENPSLGMLLPLDKTPMSDSTFAINISFSDEGYISDSDAKDMDYDDLLSSMKEDTKEASEYRVEAGYEAIELVGWASPPFYDETSKKLHWAKELKFGDYPENTLNYSIRILGRRGYLNLNAIGEMYVLDQVKEDINPILNSINFNDGHKYSDFDPQLDKVAAVGIGGLIAGKVLMKAGILAKVGILLAKFWKIILFAFIGFGAFFKNMFFGKKEEDVDVASNE